MRFSICAVDRDLSPDMPFPLRGRSYGECAEMAEKLGFDGIELQIQDPAVYRGSELRKILDDHGIAVSAVTTGLAYTLEGLSMTHPDRGMRKAAVERLKRQLDLARELDSQILIGYLRGRKQPGQTEQEFEGILTESLGEVVEALKAAGYSQWVSLECKPLPDSWTASKNGVEYLRKVFR